METNNENINNDIVITKQINNIKNNVSTIPAYSHISQSNSSKIFDPRVFQDDKDYRLWTSESVILANNGLKNGYKLVESPYNKFVKDAHLRKGNLSFKYSADELKIIKHCMEDKIFFANNTISLKDAEKGWTRIKLRPYQETLLNRYTKYHRNIVMFPRQSGKTTTTIIEICHFLTFNYDKDCVVIAKSEKVVKDILQKLKQAFDSMPFFLQPGFISFTKTSIILDNGCRLSIGVASESVVQGFALDFLYIDEFAYIRESMVNTFWENIYPALTNNPNSKCIITSTPFGHNLFYTLWTNAINKKNNFIPYKIHWTDVPRKIPLEQFKKETINTVTENGWLMGWELSFDVGLKSVFSTAVQKMIRNYQLENTDNWGNFDPICSIDAEYCENFEFLNKKCFDYDTKNDYFLMSIDIGEGLEQDYSVIKFNKIYLDDPKSNDLKQYVDNFKNENTNITYSKYLKYQQIGVFSSNTIAEEDLGDLFLKIVGNFDMNKIKVVVESNTYGALFFHQIKMKKNYDTNFSKFTFQAFAKFWRDSKDSYEYGLLWRSDSKKVAVKSYTKLISNQIFKTTHSQTIEEQLNFGRQKTGTYKANYGHDDLIMSDITAAFFITSENEYSKMFLQDVFKKLLQKKVLEQIEYMKINDHDYHIDSIEFKNLKIDINKPLVNRYYKVDQREFHVRDHEAEYNKNNKKDNNIYI